MSTEQSNRLDDGDVVHIRFLMTHRVLSNVENELTLRLSPDTCKHCAVVANKLGIDRRLATTRTTEHHRAESDAERRRNQLTGFADVGSLDAPRDGRLAADVRS